MTKTIALIGALDTKGDEFAFVKAQIERHGHQVLLIDTSIMADPSFPVEVSASQVAEAAGNSLANLRQEADRGQAIEVMAKGAAAVAKQRFEQGQFSAILGMGGSAGTAIASAAMRQLPVGFPKILVSTLAAGDTTAYVGTKDIVLIPSVVDVAGVNRISAQIFANAAAAISGMVEADQPIIEKRPLIAATMFGNTTQLVDQCRALLTDQGYETLVFHATGTGGRIMEDLINEGYFDGLLDLTTTEWADELTGGVLTAGPERMNAAAQQSVPQIIAPGCLDMANFWAADTIPQKYAHRLLYKWNPNITLMRTTPEENTELGKILAQKANAAQAPVAIYLPLKGVSILDSPGGEFWWPEANQALFSAIKENVRDGIEVIELDNNINDPAFAQAVTEKLLQFLS